MARHADISTTMLYAHHVDRVRNNAQRDSEHSSLQGRLREAHGAASLRESLLRGGAGSDSGHSGLPRKRLRSMTSYSSESPLYTRQQGANAPPGAGEDSPPGGFRYAEAVPDLRVRRAGRPRRQDGEHEFLGVGPVRHNAVGQDGVRDAAACAPDPPDLHQNRGADQNQVTGVTAVPGVVARAAAIRAGLVHHSRQAPRMAVQCQQ